MTIRLGMFDSGLGGLTVLRRVLERHGPLQVIYLGDTARVPYGSRSAAEIRTIASEVVRWLSQHQISTVVMACNTTNALARDVAEGQAGVPVVGLIGAAAAMVRETRVGVLATPATVASGAYRESIEALHPGTLVVQQACPDFVPLIESGDLRSEALRDAASRYLQPLMEASVESVVLGHALSLAGAAAQHSVAAIHPADRSRHGCRQPARCLAREASPRRPGSAPCHRGNTHLCHG